MNWNKKVKVRKEKVYSVMSVSTHLSAEHIHYTRPETSFGQYPPDRHGLFIRSALWDIQIRLFDHLSADTTGSFFDGAPFQYDVICKLVIQS